MRKDVVKQLVIVNYASTLKYHASDPTTQKSKNKKIQRSLLKQLLLLLGASIIYAIAFSIAMIFSPIDQLETVIDAMFSLMTSLLIFTSISSIFSVLFESNDLQNFRPYPFTEAEIMISKGISVIMSLTVYLLPTYVLQVIAFLRVETPWWVAILASIPLTLLLSSALGLLSIILVSLLAKTSWFGRYQKILSTLLMVLNFLSLYIGSYLLRFLSDNNLLLNFSLFKIFYLAVVDPFSSEFILHLSIWLVVIICLIVIVQKHILPTFYEESLKVSQAGIHTRTIQRTNHLSLTRSLWHYNFSLIKNSSSVMYLTFFTAFFPIVFFGRSLFQILKDIPITPGILLGSTLLGMGFAVMTTTSTSLPAIMISLDGANYDYLQSIPFNMKKYFKIKFIVGYLVQSILPLLLIIGLQVWGAIPIYAILFSLAAYYLASYPLSMFFFCRDSLDRETQWNNVTELTARKKKGLGCLTGITYALSLLAVAIGFYSSVFLAIEWALLIVVMIWTFVAIIAYYYYHFRFRRLLNGQLKK